MISNSFKIEGIELRVKQKPITETVIQSAKRDLIVSISPKIFLNNDGKLYFQDNIVRNAIPLEKINNLYKRIKYEDGQLNFYNKDLSSSVSLSQFTKKNNLSVNINSLLYSTRNFWTPNESFNGISTIENLYNSFSNSSVINNTISTDVLAGSGIFWESFITDKLRSTNKTIFDTFLERFIPGIISGGGFPSAEFCDKEECTLQNLNFFINDNNIGLSRLPTDVIGKIYLFDQNLITLDNYIFSNLYKYNGIGKFINKIFGPNIPSTETYNNYFFKDNGYTTTTLGQLDTFDLTSFIISASGNVQCGESFIPDISAGNSGAYVLGNLGVGYIGIKVDDSDLTTSTSISANAISSYLGCNNTNIIGNIESQSGIIPINGLYKTFEINDFISNYKIWYSDFNSLDNSGSAKITTVYSPRFTNYDSIITIDAITNAVFENIDGSLVKGNVIVDPVNFSQNTDTVVIGIFPAGDLIITLKNGAVKYINDDNVLFNESISGSGIGELRTSLGKIDYLYNQDQIFTITTDQEPVVVEAWYQDNNNIGNEGFIEFSFNFIPENILYRTPPPNIQGQGLFYNTLLYKYQPIILEEISKSISATIFQQFVLEMHQVLVLNGYINGSIAEFNPDPLFTNTVVFHFLEENKYNFNVLMSDILEETRQRMLDKTNIIKNELKKSVQNAFSNEKTNLINLSDFNRFAVGGQFLSSQIFDVDFSLFNGTWIDLDNFYVVSPKINNDSGISAMASLNVDITHRTDMRFEFRLFETVSQTELDRVMLQSFNYNPSTDIGNILNEYTETVPIQLHYIGPVPQVQCLDDIYKKCLNATDIKSHVKLNTSDLYSPDVLHKGFKVITDRFKELGVSAKIGDFDNSAGGTNIIDLPAPRIIRVQWRMIIDKNKVSDGIHKKMISNIAFNSNTPRSDDFEISLNVYNLGNLEKQNFLSQGVVKFDNKNKKRIAIPLLSTNSFNYSISLSCDKNINVWFEDKSSNGFTIIAEKKFTGEVSWVINKQIKESIEEKNIKEPIVELPTCLVDYKPKFGSLSNFDIFKKEGYQLDIISENFVDNNIGISSSSSSEDFNSVVTINQHGVSCSNDCINDCPVGWFCSSVCPNAHLTTSGCACCECITDVNCPYGFTCNGFGQCV